MENFKARVLLVEDDLFTSQILQELMIKEGFEVTTASSVAEAIDCISDYDPHVVITDLHFGATGPTGADLLEYLNNRSPWVGKLILTSHSAPQLAIPNGISIPDNVKYLVKSQLNGVAQLSQAITESISEIYFSPEEPLELDPEDKVTISSSQAEILRMIADGLTNQAIAIRRGTSLRATETLIQRTFMSLGIKGEGEYNPRIIAARMWQQGKVTIK